MRHEGDGVREEERTEPRRPGPGPQNLPQPALPSSPSRRFISETEGRPSAGLLPSSEARSPVGLQRELGGLEGGTCQVTGRNTPSRSGCRAGVCPRPALPGRPRWSQGPEQTVNVRVRCGLRGPGGVLPPFSVPCGWSRGE